MSGVMPNESWHMPKRPKGMSPGGMVDMARHGCLCSTIAEATTAVENRETAREEREKAQALWRVAVEFGFVFRLADFLQALTSQTIHRR